MKGEYINESLKWAGSEEVSAAYYHATAARARKLHAEATTPRRAVSLIPTYCP
jgi:hypothetical protein